MTTLLIYEGARKASDKFAYAKHNSGSVTIETLESSVQASAWRQVIWSNCMKPDTRCSYNSHLRTPPLHLFNISYYYYYSFTSCYLMILMFVVRRVLAQISILQRIVNASPFIFCFWADTVTVVISVRRELNSSSSDGNVPSHFATQLICVQYTLFKTSYINNSRLSMSFFKVRWVFISNIYNDYGDGNK